MNNNLNFTEGSNYIEIPVKGKSTTLKVQWGNSYSGQTVTFPKSFSNSSWSIAVCQSNPANDIGQFYTLERTKSSFKMYKYSSQCNYHWIAVGY